MFSIVARRLPCISGERQRRDWFWGIRLLSPLNWKTGLQCLFQEQLCTQGSYRSLPFKGEASEDPGRIHVVTVTTGGLDSISDSEQKTRFPLAQRCHNLPVHWPPTNSNQAICQLRRRECSRLARVRATSLEWGEIPSTTSSDTISSSVLCRKQTWQLWKGIKGVSVTFLHFKEGPGSGMLANQLFGKRSWWAVSANSCGVNTHTVADFKLPKVEQPAYKFLFNNQLWSSNNTSYRMLLGWMFRQIRLSGWVCSKA